MSPGRTRVLAAACVVLAALALFWGKQVSLGKAAMVQSDAALASGDRALAIEKAKEAAQHRAPFASSTQLGFARLQSIADDAEAHGDIETMKAALIAMRSAADSTDNDTWRALANDALPRCAMRAEASPALRLKEGCSSEGNPSCSSAMKLELATPTHPPVVAHAAIALLAVALGALAMRLTRSRPARSRAS